MKKRINIGVLVSNLESEYSHELCLGINHAAHETDTNIVIFTGMMRKGLDPVLDEIDYQCNTIYNIAGLMNMDVLIVSLGTISAYATVNNSSHFDFLKQLEGQKILILENDIPGYPSIVIDNKTGMRECIEHLIVGHGYKHIAFIGGSESNFDAIERENIYYDCMKKYGLHTDSTMFGRGMFTNNTEGITSSILDNNPDLEAIVCANDDMAAGCYREINRRGLVVGQDIAVTGFDDSIRSQSMDPPMTTVRVNTYNLGYNSVYEAIRIYGGQNILVKTISSEFIHRASCGNHQLERKESLDRITSTGEQYISDVVRLIITECVVHSCNIRQQLQLYNLIQPLIECIYYGCNNLPFDKNQFIYIRKYIRQILNNPLSESISIDSLQRCLNIFLTKLSLSKDNYAREQLMQLINNLNIFMTHHYHIVMEKRSRQLKYSTWISTYITRDALHYDGSNQIYKIIQEKLKLLKITSGYIYLYENPILADCVRNKTAPQEIYLKSFHNTNSLRVFDDGEYTISLAEMLNNPYINSTSRQTIVLFDLYMNNEQHGFFATNSELTNFDDVYYSYLQLCTAIKYIHLIKEKDKIEQMLKDSNLLLQKQSNSDELTSVLNRRGFLSAIRDTIDSNTNKKAILFYCDVDNLKMINDMYSHSEGDYAIRFIAKVLKRSMRNDDVVGRMGGDEFTVLTIPDTENPTIADKIIARIKHNCEKQNKLSDKPYYISISVGSIEFTCNESINIKEIISSADAALYQSKRSKRTTIEKQEII